MHRVVFVCLLAAAAPAPAALPDLSGPFLHAEGHLSVFSDVADRSLLAGTFGYALRPGWRWGAWGAFFNLEHDLWLATELEKEVVQGAWNVGVGADLVYADGFVHTSLAAGPSILAFDTVLDEAGTVGLFADFRPVGLRWDLAEGWVVALDPIGFSVVAPVLDGIPLVQIAYRTGLFVEWRPW